MSKKKKEPALTSRIELDLTDHEIAVLSYLIGDAASPYASDPLKDTYELGIGDEETATDR